MKLSNWRNVFGMALMAMLIVTGASLNAMGQGRGRRNSGFDRKCEKFVNCHDARDGRWDGRGPNRDRDFRRSWWRRHRRDRDRDWDTSSRRRRNRDRDRFDRIRWRR